VSSHPHDSRSSPISALNGIRLVALCRSRQRCHVTFPAYATERGRTLIDRRLYPPEHSWCSDPERHQDTQDVRSTTKPRMATETLAAARDAGITASGVTGDQGYGQEPHLRHAPEARGIGYVLAVACSARVRRITTAAPLSARTPSPAVCRATAWHGMAWQRHSAGNGARGPHHYDWAWVHIGSAAPATC
jgi:SRSO17 transposase